MTNIDWVFIGDREGAKLLDGYVPIPSKKGKSNSGVTIATGFDMGGETKASLEKLGLGATLVAKLTPYCKMRMGVAKAYLRSHPLRITMAEAEAIDHAVQLRVVDALVVKYDKDARPTGVTFESLPIEPQTVIASVEFQYGSAQSKCPTFWRLVTHQQWKETVAELRNFGDIFTKRRNLEADYLEKLVIALAKAEKAKAAQAN